MKRYTVVDVGPLLELRYLVINPQGKLVAGFKKGSDADVYVMRLNKRESTVSELAPVE